MLAGTRVIKMLAVKITGTKSLELEIGAGNDHASIIAAPVKPPRAPPTPHGRGVPLQNCKATANKSLHKRLSPRSVMICLIRVLFLSL